MGRAETGRGVCSLIAASSLPLIARAQEFPADRVRVVLPFPAGGASDTITRLVTSRLAVRWKQPVVVENKAGASGVVGSELVARARADGYTLLVTTGSHTSNPVTLKSLPYDTERDFVPITILADTPFALVGSTSAGFDTAEKFLAAARAKPGQFAFGSSENTSRLVGELFRQRADLQLRAVPYKGASPMLQDLAGGHIPVGFTTPLSAISLHRAGSAKILAITSDRRLTVLPEVPTMQEVGVLRHDLPHLVLHVRPRRPAVGSGQQNPRGRRGGVGRTGGRGQDPRPGRGARRRAAGRAGRPHPARAGHLA